MREFHVLSLQTCLRPRKAKPMLGAPPTHLVEAGVACMCLEDILSLGMRLGQSVLVTGGRQRGRGEEYVQESDDLIGRLETLQIGEGVSNPTAISLMVWPLSTVPPGFMATSEICCRALHIPYVKESPPRPELKPKSISAKKKRKSASGPGTPSTASPAAGRGTETRPIFPTVWIKAVPLDHREVARTVVVSSEPILSGIYLADVKDKLLDLLVSENSVVATSVCGEEVLVTVSKIVSSSGDTSEIPCLARVTQQTVFSTEVDSSVKTPTERTRQGDNNPFQTDVIVGGLEQEAETLKDMLWAAGAYDSDASIAYPPLPMQSFSSKRPRGALLYGPPGTGKTSLALQLAKESGARVIVVSSAEIVGSFLGESERALRSVFARAAAVVPSIIILDEIDAICVRRNDPAVSDADIRLTSALLTHMDKLPERNFLIGTTNRPDALDEAMRRAGRLDREIEIPVPSAAARLSILSKFASTAEEGRVAATGDVLREIADSAHGFVGADLAALWREAARNAIHRNPSCAVIARTDLIGALRATKPSALREVAVEVPRVKWEDVGGNREAKMRLKEAVELPLKMGGGEYAKIGIRPPRGVLLFGPPGCSKTLLAKAVATEASVNFLSVKGPELLSKYVGDSEKAVRNIFVRARSVAPAVIFFDELDALAGSRGRGGAEDRVLAQLLTEMDGVAVVDDKPVVVVAATNRPDMIDAALLRPGRIDALVYVGLPDKAAREEILRIHMRKQPCEGVDVTCVAGKTEGYSGAELAAVVREAALAAMEEDVENARKVFPRHYDMALQRVQPRTTPELIQFYQTYIRSARGVIIR